MMQQDELAGLFARNMTFSNPTPPPDESQALPKPAESAPQPQPTVYASQHYVPNYHRVPIRFHATPQASPEPEPAPEPVRHIQPLSDSEIVDILNRNSIDPSSLFPSQVALFRNADNDQRLRLLELWRISPPNLGCYDLAKEQSTWLETTLQKEEQLAKLRYERQMVERQFGSNSKEQGMSDVEPERPSTAPESRGRISVHAEPYMMSGYELLAQREYEQSSSPLKETTKYNQSTDPVYRGSGEWAKGIQDMENRYGAFEQTREGSTPQALNGLDEDMVM